MGPAPAKPSIHALSLGDLQGLMGERAPWRAAQVLRWLWGRGERDPDRWTNVGKRTRALLRESCDWGLPEVVWQGRSEDGTRKFLMRMADGESVETVAIPGPGRTTLCVSSQVGCALRCSFCRTGTMGLSRHLSAGEITGQFAAASRWLDERGEARPTNVVFMGQGEPLHNPDAVRKSIEVLMEPAGPAIGRRKITLSTSAPPSWIGRLADFPPVNLAVSLHAADDGTRSRLMPVSGPGGVGRLLEAVRALPLSPHRRVTYEYVLIRGVNDRRRDAGALADLLDPRRSKVNLIPFNEHPGSPFRRPDDARVRGFQDALLGRGLACTVRASRGRDVMAACGQLMSEGAPARAPAPPSPPSAGAGATMS